MNEFGDFAENPGLSVAGATTTDEVLVGEDEDEGFGEFESAGKKDETNDADEFGDFEDAAAVTPQINNTAEKTSTGIINDNVDSTSQSLQAIAQSLKSILISKSSGATLASEMRLSERKSTDHELLKKGESLFFAKREEKVSAAMMGLGMGHLSNTISSGPSFWGPSRCGKCRLLVRYLSTVCLSCGHRILMAGPPGRALDGTVSETLLMQALDLPTGAELKRHDTPLADRGSNGRSPDASPSQSGELSSLVGRQARTASYSAGSEDLELFGDSDHNFSPQLHRPASQDLMDSAFSGGSDQISGAKATFGDNLLSETLGDLGLGEDSSGSSTNRNLENGPEVDILDMLKSKQQQARAPSMSMESLSFEMEDAADVASANY